MLPVPDGTLPAKRSHHTFLPAMKPDSTTAPPKLAHKQDPNLLPDDPSLDQNHDESRRNGFDPAVARALKGGKAQEGGTEEDE